MVPRSLERGALQALVDVLNRPVNPVRIDDVMGDGCSWIFFSCASLTGISQCCGCGFGSNVLTRGKIKREKERELLLPV
jgi:hypothetical protein